MTERIGEELFNELYADTLSDCPSDFEINCSDSESDESDIIPPKRQKRSVIESDSESDFEDWNENDITPSLEDYSNISGVTVELSDTASISEVTD